MEDVIFDSEMGELYWDNIVELSENFFLPYPMEEPVIEKFTIKLLFKTIINKLKVKK